MRASDLTADLSYIELARIVDENGEPFESLAQCELYLRATIVRQNDIDGNG